MTRFEKWLIKRIIKRSIERDVIQGYDHVKENIRNLYGMIQKACRQEFIKDSKPTLDCFLREQFEHSIEV